MDGWMDGLMNGWGRWIPLEQGSYSQCGEPSDSKMSPMWEIATGRGGQGQGTQRERDCVIRSSVKAFGTWVPVG